MPAFRTDRRKTDRLDDRAPLPGSDFLVGVDRRPPADAHEVVEVVDPIGGLTGELGRASVRTPDERGVDPGVVGGEHVRLVVADENRGLGAEVFEGARCVRRRRRLFRERLAMEGSRPYATSNRPESPKWSRTASTVACWFEETTPSEASRWRSASTSS